MSETPFGGLTGVRLRKLSLLVRFSFLSSQYPINYRLIEHDYAQYLAISTIPASPLPHEPKPPAPDVSLDAPTSSKDETTPKSAIQIWRFGPSKTPTDKEDFGTASCAMVLCLDGVPPARVLRWCPLPADDKDEVRLGLDHECRRN